MSKTSTLHEYARMGAKARIAELKAEIAGIQQMFPDVDGPAPARKRPGRPAAPSALAKLMEPAAAPKRKRRKLSAAARKAISDAQKKRWAALRAVEN